MVDVGIAELGDVGIAEHPAARDQVVGGDDALRDLHDGGRLSSRLSAQTLRGRLPLPDLLLPLGESLRPEVQTRRCRPIHSRKCRPECGDIFTGVGVTQCTVRRTLNRNGMGWSWDIAKCIVYYESRWSRTAVSPGGHLGLWQIDGRYFNGTWASLPGPWDSPEANTKAAIYIYRIQGWRAWSVHAYCGV